MQDQVADEKIKEAVRQTYGDIARRVGAESAPASCCGPRPFAWHPPHEEDFFPFP